MDTTKIVTLNIRVDSTVSDLENAQNPRLAFWTRVRAQARYSNDEYVNPEIATPERFETILESSFGSSLNRLFTRYFATSITGEVNYQEKVSLTQLLPEAPLDLAHFYFKAKVTTYDSLNFALEIAGIQKLAKLLDGNFDLFVMLMESFIPQAFDNTFSDYYRLDGLHKFAISIPNEVRDNFFEAKKPPQHQHNNMDESSLPTTTENRSRFFWTLTNFSLVVPVLIAAIFIYILYAGVLEERKQIMSSMELVLTHQELVLEQSQERMADLQELEEVLINRLLIDLDPAQITPNSPNNTQP